MPLKKLQLIQNHENIAALKNKIWPRDQNIDLNNCWGGKWSPSENWVLQFLVLQLFHTSGANILLINHFRYILALFTRYDSVQFKVGEKNTCWIRSWFFTFINIRNWHSVLENRNLLELFRYSGTISRTFFNVGRLVTLG